MTELFRDIPCGFYVMFNISDLKERTGVGVGSGIQMGDWKLTDYLAN